LQQLTKNPVIKGTVVLTVAALIIKILSAIYRIPYQNFVGDVGYYVYQQVYPLYAIFLILVTNGFPVVLSKLYVEARADGTSLELYTRNYVQKALITFGFISFSLLFIFSHSIASGMGDVKLGPVIKIISIVYLLLPFIALKRGAYQSEYNMVPTAMSQIIEQTIRVAVIILSAVVLSKLGYSVYTIAEGAFLGALIGGIAAFIILTSYSKKATMVADKKEVTAKQKKSMRRKFYIYTFSIGTTSLLIVWFQLADSINLYKLLLETSTELEAKTLKGVYDRAWPLIQLGLVIATSLALNMIPVVTSEKNKEKQVDKLKSSVKFTVMISLAAAVGLIVIMKPTNMFLFMSAEGTVILQVLALCIFFGSIIITLSSIMQGLGYMFTPVIAILIGFVLKVALNAWMVNWFGILGAAITTVSILAVIALYLYVVLNDKLNVQLLSITNWLKIMVSTFVMGAVVYFVQNQFILNGRLENAILAIGSAFIGLAVFVLCIVLSNVFTKEEKKAIPLWKKF